jgi:chromosome segregation ATPase
MKGTPGGDAELVLQMYKLQDESAVQEARIASLMSQVQQLTRDLYVARQDSEKHVLTISQLENQIMQMQRDHEVQMDLRQEQFQQLHQQMQQQMQSQTSRLASEPSEVRTIAVSASAATEDMRAMLAAYSSELETQSAILEARHRVLEDCTKALADERNLRLELEEANRNARAALATRDKTIVQLQTESSSLRSLLSSATHLGGGAGVISVGCVLFILHKFVLYLSVDATLMQSCLIF